MVDSHKKKLFCILFCINFFFVLVIPIVSTFSFGISPEKIEINGEINKIICKNFSLFGNEGGVFIGDLRWSERDTKNILNYNLSSESMNIIAVYPKEAKPGRHTICIKGSKNGEYYGGLFYKIKGLSYGIGTWIKVNLEKKFENGKEVDGGLYLTGKSTEEKINSPIEEIYLIETIFLVFLLFVLIVLLKNSEPGGRLS